MKFELSPDGGELKVIPENTLDAFHLGIISAMMPASNIAGECLAGKVFISYDELKYILLPTELILRRLMRKAK